MHNIQPNSPFSVLPKDIHNEILQLLPIKDLKAMMEVNHWHRSMVKKCIRNYKLLELYRLPPSTEVSDSLGGFVVNRLDFLALKIESIPFIGYICSIPRAGGGLIASIGFGLAEGVCFLRAKAADTDQERKERMLQKDFCSRQAMRGALNLSRGIIHCIPLVGSVFAEDYTPNSFYFDKQIEQCIKKCQAALTALDWIEYVYGNVCPIMSEIDLRSIKKVLANRNKLSYQLEKWNSRGQRFSKRMRWNPFTDYPFTSWENSRRTTKRLSKLVFEKVKELEDQIEQGILA